jgi:uncharacterized protein YjbJ (UPF0337 family)
VIFFWGWRELTDGKGIIHATGRPFPPPRARPVISGVVDIKSATPLFFADSGPWNILSAHGFSVPLAAKQERAMNWDRVEGNWKEFKGKAQQKWGKLTNDDLDIIEGKRQELSGRLQRHYGYAKDESEREIDAWLRDVS